MEMDGPGRPVKIFLGQKRNSRIFHCGDGFFYNQRERRGFRIRLTCRKRNSRGQGCPGTASISLTTGLMHHLTPHNHLGDPLLRHEYTVRRAMIEEAKILHDQKIRSILDGMKLR